MNLIPDFTVEPCAAQYSLCFALMERDFQIEYEKGINPDTMFLLKNLLEWISNYVEDESLTSFHCPMNEFIGLVRMVNFF